MKRIVLKECMLIDDLFLVFIEPEIARDVGTFTYKTLLLHLTILIATTKYDLQAIQVILAC